MGTKKISYTNKTFEEYKDSLINILNEYYPEITDNINDSSVGEWFIDMIASVADNLSYHIDKSYNETNLDCAQQTSTIYALARSNGLKIPGPKASMTEVVFSCELPASGNNPNSDSTLSAPNFYYAPIIKKGTTVTDGRETFELLEDVDFNEAVNSQGVPDRKIIPRERPNGSRVYTVEKTVTVYAGELKTYKQVINSSMVKPFMEVIIPDSNVMNVESIIFKDGVDYKSNPLISEYMNGNEFVPAESTVTNVDTYRFFEVDSLVDQYRWDDSCYKAGNQSEGSVPTTFTYEKDGQLVASVTKGAWIPLTQKFITEFTDNGYLKIIFGSGEEIGTTVDYSKATDFSKYQITKMIRNNFMGVLPKGGFTIYVLYRAGGGVSSNVAVGAINSISYLNANICAANESERRIANAIKNTIRVTNTIPSVSGKDMPSPDEIKAMIKYTNASQNRCVTLKDYEMRVQQMPPRYGCPFRLKAIEENNKVMLYLLGIEPDKKLTSRLPQQMILNIMEYLSMYRSINDYVEIKNGRIVNISIEFDVYIDKNYNVADVVKSMTDTITNYMDVNKHFIGEDIFVGDIIKEVGKIDGVLNTFETRVYNEFGEGYSSTRTSQPTVPIEYGDLNGQEEIDLLASDYILNSEPDEMFEIKYPEKDIRIRVKTR